LVRFRYFVFLALSADGMLFALLTMGFLASRGSFLPDPRNHPPISGWYWLGLPWVVYLDAALLMASCVTMEMARRNIFREIDVLEEWLGLGKPALRRALPWIGATLGWGMLFVAGQMWGGEQWPERGLFSDPWGLRTNSFLGAIVGLHTLHVLAGLVALGLCLGTLGWLKRVELRQIAVDTTAWYWQTMSFVWLMLMLVQVLGR
jgi:cytochrome c oxidase subunit 3